MPHIRTFFLASLSALTLWGCASTEVSPIEAGQRPDDPSSDEAGLWLQMDKYETALKTAGVVVHDEDLNAYVRDVTCRLTGDEYCQDLRIYILDVPAFNASMAPNGVMMVYTGMLLRAENEAQLAFVLGHEFTHYRERHSLSGWRAQKNAANASYLFAVAVGASGVPDAALFGNAVFAGRLFGFNRDQEREADDLGYDLAVKAGYDGRQAAGLWQAVIDEVEASSSPSKKRKFARASIFSTHPLSAERVETLREKAGDVSSGDIGLFRHRDVIRPHLNDWLDTDITRRDLGEHLYLIRRLQDLGIDKGLLSYRLGQAYRVRREDGDFEKALEAYREAVTYDDAPTEAWRELGNMARRLDETATAVSAYRTYLDKAPEAADRALVESFIRKIENVATVPGDTDDAS